MTGVEAFDAIRNRKAVRRIDWMPHEYVEVADMGDGTEQVLVHIDKSKLCVIHRGADAFCILLKELLENDDWEVVE